ncbi:hypothetical protein [Actinocrinis sp.]|uniref:hypothetical protein n=1 Tax=Actinocrinis sp. TaxID=1920516 RepID=UPI002D4E9354|nr:hypothetical protein [Actinocrinis sp.]HZP54990.1 hypothetical protein [Actinocrinis sp.]
MTEFLPPGRSIERVTVTPEGVEVWCDCAAITVLDFRDVPAAALPLEQAFTCDGCHSVHWFTLGATREDGAV